MTDENIELYEEEATLTAELEKIVAICEQYGCCASFYAGHDYAFDAVRRFRQWADGRNTDAKESRAAVARLTTEQQLLEKRTETLSESARKYCEAMENADAEVQRLQRVREQAIQDIEALPAHIVEFSGHAMSDPPILVKHLDRDRVLSILRGST